MELTTRLSWEALVEAEPQLGALLVEIQSVAAGPGFCANASWYGYRRGGRGFKARLLPLVGWERRGPGSWLRGHDAYDLAYRTLYDALPDCRHEGFGC